MIKHITKTAGEVQSPLAIQRVLRTAAESVFDNQPPQASYSTLHPFLPLYSTLSSFITAQLPMSRKNIRKIKHLRLALEIRQFTQYVVDTKSSPLHIQRHNLNILRSSPNTLSPHSTSDCNAFSPYGKTKIYRVISESNRTEWVRSGEKNDFTTLYAEEAVITCSSLWKTRVTPK